VLGAAGHIGAAARVSVKLATLDVYELKSETALARVERVFDILSEQGATDAEHEADLAIVAAELARRLFLLHRSTDVALERVELALDIAERHGLWETFCEAVNTKGLILGGRGRHEEGRALVECALDHALALNLHNAALRANNNLAAALQETDLVRAREQSEKGAALARLVGDRRSEMQATLGVVPILVDLGRWDEATRVEADYLGTTDDALTESEVPRELLYSVWVHIWRGEAAAAQAVADRLSYLFGETTNQYAGLNSAVQAALLRDQGRTADALEMAGAALRKSGRSVDDLYVARWIFQEAVDAAFSLGDAGAVQEFIDMVSSRFRRGLGPALDGQVSLSCARLAIAQRRDAEVSSHARDALDLFAQMQMPFWKAVTRTEYGEWLAAQGRDTEAEEMLAQARSTFVQLGAKPWMVRVTPEPLRSSTETRAAAATPA
jgi:tetratricopeptide (TPR) repeat protein